MEIMCLSACDQNYVTIPLVIYTTFSMILFVFKTQLSRKLFYVINTVHRTLKKVIIVIIKKKKQWMVTKASHKN